MFNVFRHDKHQKFILRFLSDNIDFISHLNCINIQFRTLLPILFIMFSTFILHEQNAISPCDEDTSSHGIELVNLLFSITSALTSISIIGAIQGRIARST
jgi:hypothetical protein